MNLPVPDADFIERLLAVIEDDILPMTTVGVASGNKVFGAALLHKDSHELLLAETNYEIGSPLHHGEMHALKKFYELPEATRPSTDSLIFLTTHEPCSLCLSAITWCGFDNFYYLFSHEDSRDAFAIPHDLKILKEVFNVEPGAYQRKNAFWDSFAIRELIDSTEEPARASLLARVERIVQQYADLSTDYQSSKHDNHIPLS
ncbi:nucleoside deaminase [Granulosicoccus antarcticus]|uniref:CMP/dCMP-type deaminase domain-containing protein n=1 Tax=Granulosicoccus antarcticus IMCC3135 TaxID=1192854 RepID=A0A2Z2NVB7_9GAMM|nr:nucleoside deaminase [Granulosicoccus antarcticus]ASJ71074.1 hypothetical protein IMCC3135_04805 [Granulosicoccus antarcticus IMCC3135]